MIDPILGDEPQTEPETEPAAAEPETTAVTNVNGEVIDEALVNAWVVEVQYNNPADPDGPEGPEGPPEG